ncbi:hypothetical protein SAMN05444050_4257 [Afipia sp. GAS231]|nr:hypothetical protein SAMN05444050_4257 [Afipia sp. GAS231]
MAKQGTVAATGGAIAAYRELAMWSVLRTWRSGSANRTMPGITKARALELAGEMLGKRYGRKDLDEATADIELKWRAPSPVQRLPHEP